jgi:putative ribosome biogenesis GTPase RsgA|tara:strand:- start:6156 stop:6446 length:291 start_codon:yes stop_codon:yes gene_type:complete
MVKLAKESIIDSILKITDTNELREISNALHQHRTYMNAQATRNFVVGDKVEFEGRRGRTVQGVVKRVKIKNIIVEETNSPFGGRWNVSASLLKKVA